MNETVSKQTFYWIGINKDGERVNGTLDAIDTKDAHNELEKNNIEIIKLVKSKPKSEALFSLPFFGPKKIKHSDILLFTRYLSTMLSAGLPVTQALEIISHDQDNPSMQALINTIRSNIEGGKTLAEAFSRHPEHFNQLYCSLINAGERSGTLDQILIRIASFLDRTENLKRKVKKAMIYPAAIITIAVFVSVILLVFVVPQFEKMFKSFGAELPIFTQIVVGISRFMRDYWWVILVAVVLLYFSIKHVIRTSEYAKYLIDKWSLRIYIIGPILTKSILARATRTLSTTLAAGMPIVDSMQTIADVVDNRVFKRAILSISEDVQSGRQLSVSMSSTKLFPNMVIQMIAVGEASGSLENMLNRVADYFEEEVNAIVDTLSSLLEPIIMLVLGVLIGGFVIAMYVPIFRIGSLF